MRDRFCLLCTIDAPLTVKPGIASNSESRRTQKPAAPVCTFSLFTLESSASAHNRVPYPWYGYTVTDCDMEHITRCGVFLLPLKAGGPVTHSW